MSASPLPVVVQVGFAGPRDVPPEHADAVRAKLTESLRGLLGPQRFLCGISQVAIGADMLFLEACQQLGVLQRIFLPQPREEYLAAKGSNGQPDFSDAQRDAARALLDGRGVIEQRVVSRSSDRHERFEEANLEIVRESDMILCVTNEQPGKPGGTDDLLATALRHGKPVLELQLRVKDGNAVLDEKPHGSPPEPSLPSEVAHARAADELPTLVPYADALKAACSRKASKFQGLFERGAFVIIGTHALATACAVFALLLPHDHPLHKPLLGLELLLIASGFATHLLLHRRHAVRVWAASRLIAEVARAVKSLAQADVSLDFLFAVPHPSSMQPLLRTLKVLHLAVPKVPWNAARDTYVTERLTKEKGGQLDYYGRSVEAATSRLRWAQGLFYGFSFSAFAATAIKFVFHPGDWLTAILGVEAILLPVLAVSALSLAASFDLEARVHTFSEIHRHLQKAVELLREARSKRELERLVHDTEVQLLGETVNWASRRSFTSVA